MPTEEVFPRQRPMGVILSHFELRHGNQALNKGPSPGLDEAGDTLVPSAKAEPPAGDWARKGLLASKEPLVDRRERSERWVQLPGWPPGSRKPDKPTGRRRYEDAPNNIPTGYRTGVNDWRLLPRRSSGVSLWGQVAWLRQCSSLRQLSPVSSCSARFESGASTT